MNKTELIAAVAENTGLTKKDAEKAVNAIQSLYLYEKQRVRCRRVDDRYPQQATLDVFREL